MEKKQIITRKKATGATAAVLAGALLLTGTLAFRDFTQHKTNKFSTTSVQNNVVLVENFKEQENWKVADGPITKEVSVRNGQDSDDASKYVYEDGYVRLQFKEFMEIGNQDYEYSTKRYMIDTKGNFIKGATAAAVKSDVETVLVAGGMTAAEAAAAVDSSRIVKVLAADSYFDTADTFYYETAQGDINGQYGKYLVKDVKTVNAESLDPTVTNQEANAKPEHHDPTSSEDLYTTKLWNTVAGDNYAKPSYFTPYVKWTLDSANVTTMSAWNGQPVAKWIIDTDSPEGWVYWGQPLKHSATAAIPSTQTYDFLKSVELIKQPEGASQYFIHVNQEVLGLDEMYAWKTDAPAKYVNAMGGTLSTPVEIAKQALKTAIDNAKAAKTTGMSTASIKALNDELVKAEAIYAKPTATKAEVNAVTLTLANAIKDLAPARISKNPDGKTVTISGKNFTILEEVNGKALVIADKLTAAEFTKMGIATDLDGDKIKYYQGATTSTLYDKYEGSKLQSVDKAFYNMIIANNDDAKQAILGVKIDQEPFNPTGWNTRKDFPTIVDETNGVKTAFTLSVSDINQYGIGINSINDSTHYVWLRSPGKGDRDAARANMNGKLDYHYVSYDLVVRPALWINID